MILVNNRDKVDWRPGMTVQDVLDAMHYSYVLITVTLNGKYIDPADYESTPVPDNSDFKAIHVHHGG